MNYLTVKEFAEQVGVSRQAVYKRLRRKEQELMQYITTTDNITKIAAEASVLFVNQTVNQNEDFKPESDNPVNQTVNQNEDFKPESDQSVNHGLQEFIENLQAEKQAMSNQINSLIAIQSKHLEQIESLQAQLLDKDKLIGQLSMEILNQTRLPVVIPQPKQTIWSKIKHLLIKK